MPQNRECDYCGNDVEPGTGTMFVRTDGTVIHYCSSKCEKNADLGREARDLEWTEAGRDADTRAAASREAETAAGVETAEETGDAEAAEESEAETGAADEAEDVEAEEGEPEDAEDEADNEEAEA